MEKLEDLAKKVNHLEYTELKEVKSEISSIKTDLALNTQLTKSLIETNEKLSNTMSSVEKTMVSISDNMKVSNEKVEDLGNKVDKMNTRINDIDNKTKIDTSLTTKDIIKNGLMWLFGGGALVGLVTYIITNMK